MNEELKLRGIAIDEAVEWTECRMGKRILRAGTLKRIEGRMGVVESGRGKREIKVHIANLRPFEKDRQPGG